MIDKDLLRLLVSQAAIVLVVGAFLLAGCTTTGRITCERDANGYWHCSGDVGDPVNGL